MALVIAMCGAIILVMIERFAQRYLRLNILCLFDASRRSDEESLRRLGKILHLSSSRSLIVKCEEPRFVKLGTKVCDSKIREIGKTQDLFGPITAPYISIRPAVSSPAKFVHRIVYSLD